MRNTRHAIEAERGPFFRAWVVGAAGTVLFAGAVIVLAIQVEVHATGAPALACGSAWDVVAGRAGWSQWWAADLADPAQEGRPPVRTVRCPAAVNRRSLLAGGLAVAGTAVLGGAGLVARRRQPVRPGQSHRTRRLRRFGATITIVGSLLTVGGLIGLALLVANPRSTLFIYVSRPAVLLTGLLLLLPAIALVVLGRGAALVAADRASNEVDREVP